ncbi:dephospho-CoA kinase [Kocuria tytonicola]|uniref:Dephospho-CoA kinase n=1 Tax=Kocuria tytonicola TaxID=2055946 RepID=A0A3L9LCY5_9MICC|nr:dephospho-CoA kinase [Kocuria tytonicola]RLY94887.1 dephospho-CoA kinase [Kocuria tytonicola]
MTEPFTRAGRTDVLKVGLTGGIASGKSTVSGCLAGLGAVVVDADALARELQEPGAPGLAAIVAHFGEQVLDRGTGRLDRAALAALVFADREELAELNGIMHPLVRAGAARLAATVPPGGVLVQDIPLLVETGQHTDMDRVLVVEAPEAERVRRMVADRGMDPDDARRRIAAQASDAQRRAVATTVFDNSGTREDLERQVRQWWEAETA